MTQTMREQLQKLIDECNKSGVPSLEWMFDQLEAILAASQPVVSVKAGWVSVTERMSDTPRSVFVIDKNEDGYSIGYYLGGYGWGGCDIDEENVTHWHEIEYPEPPEVHQ